LRPPDRLHASWRETGLYCRLCSFCVLVLLYLAARHPSQHVDVLPRLTNRKAHIAGFRDENNPLKLLVNNTILGRGACDTFEQGHVLHLLACQLDFGLEHHFFSATNFKTSESPGSLTTIAETGKGFSQTGAHRYLLSNNDVLCNAPQSISNTLDGSIHNRRDCDLERRLRKSARLLTADSVTSHLQHVTGRGHHICHQHHMPNINV